MDDTAEPKRWPVVCRYCEKDHESGVIVCEPARREIERLEREWREAHAPEPIYGLTT